MAGKKKAKSQEGGQAEVAEAREFSNLASGLACALRAEKIMEKARLGAPGEAVAKAWEMLTDPEWILLTALAQRAPVSGSAMALVDDPAPGWSDAQVEVLAAAVDEVAAEIEQTAARPEFLAAARAYGPMAASPASSKQLHYPWMEWSSRLGQTSTGGRKRQGFAGVVLKTASAESVQARYHSNLKARDVYLNALGAGEDLSDLSAGELEERERLGAAAQAFEEAAEATQERQRALNSPSLESARGGSGPSSLVGDHPLPSVAALEEALAKAEDGRPWFSVAPPDPSAHAFRRPTSTLFEATEQGARKAVGKAWTAALSTMSAALGEAPLDASLPARRDAQLGLWSGPAAQALSHSSTWRHLAPEEPVWQALVAATGEEAHPAREGWGVWKVAKEISVLERQGGDVKQALGEAAREIKRSQEAAKKRKPLANARDENPANPPVDFGARGEGLEGLSATLRAGNARVGVAQWGVRALQSMHAVQGDHGAERALQAARPSRAPLARSLVRLGHALRSSRMAFAREAFKAGRERELAWVDATGQGAPWRQALASGSLTQKSILWAQENPLDERVSSSQDPMARLAGAGSRSLGIRAGEPEEMLAALRAELGERGLDDAGWEALSGDERARELLRELFAEMSGQGGKIVAKAGAAALAVACKALSAGRSEGLDHEDAGLLAVAAAQSVIGRQGAKEREDAVAAWDERALGSAWSASHVSSAPEARALAQRARAAGEGQKELYRALARDWSESIAAARRQGVDLGAARGNAARRIKGFAGAMPRSIAIDWASNPFAGQAAWSLFEAESPRLAAAVEASKKEGALGEWVAAASKAFKIKDAADANDLAGQCKAAAKAYFGLGEAAWKALIKQPAGLATMSKGMEPLSSSRSWAGDRDFKLVESARAVAPQEVSRAPAVGRLGMALNHAVAQGVDAAVALEALAAFESARGSEVLFSASFDARQVDGSAAALFYADESSAKMARQPKIFKEACGRLLTLRQRFDRAKAAGQDALEPKAALAEEIRDLCDWIKGSEYGVWQTLPSQPTWGQLERLSGAWHAEMAAREADRKERAKAQAEEDKFQRRLAPFAPTSSEHWEPILGKFERDGWEAVELTSQEQLSEEGREMSHCVSSYSGRCRSGELRIFSIRLNGERRCTMEARPASGVSLGEAPEEAGLSITQNKGKHNAQVANKATLSFCEETVAAANAAWSVKWRATQALRLEEEAKKKAKAKEAREGRKSASPKG